MLKPPTAVLAPTCACANLEGTGSGHPLSSGAMQPQNGSRLPQVVILSPSRFEQGTEAVLAVQQQRTVVLHLGAMEPQEAQRTIDFVSGGVYAMDGQSERLGEAVFLFAPAAVTIGRDRQTAVHAA
jgi:cell division inhibitor SepF